MTRIGDKIDENIYCPRITDEILSESREGGKPCLNQYDIRLRDPSPTTGSCGMSWPYTLDDVNKYLLVGNNISISLFNSIYIPDYGAFESPLTPPLNYLALNILFHQFFFSGRMFDQQFMRRNPNLGKSALKVYRMRYPMILVQQAFISFHPF